MRNLALKESLECPPNLIAGIKSAYTKDGLFDFAGIVVIKFSEFQI